MVGAREKVTAGPEVEFWGTAAVRGQVSIHEAGRSEEIWLEVRIDWGLRKEMEHRRCREEVALSRLESGWSRFFEDG